MRKVLLDTDVVVDFLRKGVDTDNVFQRAKDKEIRGFVSTTTGFELYNGALLSMNPKQKLEDLARLFGILTLVPLSNEQSYVASKVYAYLVKKGIPLEIRDVLIAGCAIACHLSLLTRNKQHFKRVPELHLF